nr:universal stress protein UspA [Maliibacterium massiliense]
MKKKPSVMVCVTSQKTCERLIKAGARTAKALKAPLHVVHVAQSGHRFLDDEHEGEALEYLFHISKQYEADMAVLRSDDVAESLVQYALYNKAREVIFGQSPEPLGPGNIIVQVKDRLQGVHIEVLPPQMEESFPPMIRADFVHNHT